MDKDTRKAVAKGLRAARDKMNHGGRHWIKGALRRRMIQNDVSNYAVGDNPAWGEVGYCSIGGINAVSGRAQSAVVTSKLRGPMKKALASAIIRDNGGNFQGFTLRDDLDGGITVEQAESVIIRFNDHAMTKWDDVKRVFTDAAKRA
jgi:hypothetical protein